MAKVLSPIGVDADKGVESAESAGDCGGTGDGAFRSLWDFVRRTRLEGKLVERLIQAGAMDGFGLSRPELLWQAWILANWWEENGFIEPTLTTPSLPTPQLWETLQGEYRAMGFSPNLHPMELIRERLKGAQIQRAEQLSEIQNGSVVRVAGAIICMQRPPTAKGFAFLLLGDESGLMNVVISPRVYDNYRVIFKIG